MLLPPIERWDIDARLEPLAGGHRNAVFRTAGLDRDFVFKSTRRDEASMQWVYKVQVHAGQAGFSVPRYIPSKWARIVEKGWTCEPYAVGAAFADADMGRIGNKIAAFHCAVRHVEQRPGFASCNDLLTRSMGGDVDLSTMPARLVEELRKSWRALADQPNHVIHGDLNTSNLLWSPHGQPVLLDWDECRVDAAIFDLVRMQLDTTFTTAQNRAMTAWEIACSWGIEPDHARALARDFLD